jgi:hypothetical protein
MPEGSMGQRGSVAIGMGERDIELGEGNKATINVVTGQIPEELLSELKRDFTPAEIDLIFARIHKTLAPSVARPGALFVLGPSAVGKSVFSTTQARTLHRAPHAPAAIWVTAPLTARVCSYVAVPPLLYRCLRGRRRPSLAPTTML